MGAPTEQFIRDNLKWLLFSRGATDGAATYWIAVDLDKGGGGPYQHEGSDSVELVSACLWLDKNLANDKFALEVGTIVRIDETDADVSWLPTPAIVLASTGVLSAHEARDFYPRVLNLAVDSGELSEVAADKETGISAVNTSTPLEDVRAASSVTPAVGDVLLRLKRTFGSSTAIPRALLGYVVK